MVFKTLIRWDNGFVMVFGESGNQLNDYQGRFNEQLLKIIQPHCGPHTEYRIGSWREGLWEVTPEQFFDPSLDIPFIQSSRKSIQLEHGENDRDRFEDVGSPSEWNSIARD